MSKYGFILIFFCLAFQSSTIGQSNTDRLILDEDKKVEVKLYPNPTVDFVNIEINTLEGGSFDLRNMIGKQFLTGTLDDRVKTINIESYHKGIYLLSIYDKHGTRISTKKILKE